MVCSVLEANPNSVLIERDRVDLDTMPGSQSGLKSSGVAPIEKLIAGTEDIQSQVTQDSCPASSNSESLPPGVSNTKIRDLWRLLSKSMCRLGSHQGKWEYLSEAQCSQSRECSRCGEDKARIKHKLIWKYLGEKTCEQARTCSRCNIIPMRNVFLSPDGVVRDCIIPGDRCVQIPKGGYQFRHPNWSATWEIDQDLAAHRCFRCGVIEKWSTASSD